MAPAERKGAAGAGYSDVPGSIWGSAPSGGAGHTAWTRGLGGPGSACPPPQTGPAGCDLWLACSLRAPVCPHLAPLSIDPQGLGLSVSLALLRECLCISCQLCEDVSKGQILWCLDYSLSFFFFFLEKSHWLSNVHQQGPQVLGNGTGGCPGLRPSPCPSGAPAEIWPRPLLGTPAQLQERTMALARS